MSRRTFAHRGHALRSARASRAVVRIACALACCPFFNLSAQSLDLAQYAHTAWTVQDGAPGAVRALAQGADGLFWIGSERGLFQFDGVRFERFEPLPGQALLPHGTQFLLALPDTSLWIGYFTSGVSVLHRGKILSYSTEDGLPRGTVTTIARDSGGTMWAATTRGLARLVGQHWVQIDTAAGYPGGFTGRVSVDGSGSVWVLGSDAYVLPRGAVRFEKRERPGSSVGWLVAAPDGSIWGGHNSTGVFPLADTRGAPSTGPVTYPDTGIYDLVSLPYHPAVALGTRDRLVRLSLPASADHAAQHPEAVGARAMTIPFSRTAGMSGGFVTTAMYDREGSLWIGTPTGIDRFRETKLTPIVEPGDLDAPAVAPDTNGAVWVAARHGTPAALVAIGDRVVPRRDAPGLLTCIYRDLRGGLWIGGSGLWERKGNSFASVSLPPLLAGASPGGREIQAIARDRDDRLWVAMVYEGVFRARAGRGWEQFGARQGLERVVANVITADSSGRTWLGYPGGQLVLVVKDSIRVFQPEQLALGRVLAISVYGDHVWIGGQTGVAALDARALAGSGRRLFVPLQPAGEPLRGVSGIVQTADGELWLNGADGVTRIPASEVRRALADSGYHVQYEALDYRDGLEPPAQQIRPLPSATAGTDGRIWFASEGGIAWVDPRRVGRNPVPPPVHLRVLTAGGRRYFPGESAGDTVRLPSRMRALSLEYTAYSLAVPDRVRFRYRLEGLDTTWQDASDRREAFFTNLPPGPYRFHVIAANDDGVWNTAGASLAFTIAPAWNQTWWFFGLVALSLIATPAVAAVAWQRRRARLAAERTRVRFEAMLGERTRVARELHDTLLGGMVGVVLHLEAATQRLAEGDRSTAAMADLLSTLSSQARDALTETRKSVVAMRTPSDSRLIHDQLAAVAQRTFSETDIVVQLEQAGTARPYSRTVEAELVSIAGEAMTNARRHSGCRAVWVTCRYERSELRLGVRDDGRGFDPSHPTPMGHWGLIGMRERATSIGARLTLASAPGGGTEVVLILPERSGWSAALHRFKGMWRAR